MKLTRTKRTIFVLGAALFAAIAPVVHGGGVEFSKEVLETDAKEGPAVDLGTGKFQAFPFKVTVSVRGGYDDNYLARSFDEEEAFFTNLGVGVQYNFGSPRTKISLNSEAGVTYYFGGDDEGDEFGDDDEDNFDFNASVGLSITHRASPRLTMALTSYLAYQSAPDFTTLTTGLSVDTRSRDFFYTVNKATVTYLWTPRFGTATSYTFGGVFFEDEVFASFEDRLEHTIGNEFRFLLWPTTTVVGEYRFGIVDYTEDDFRDSMSHYLLAGFDHTFSPRFSTSVRAGVEFRCYDGVNGDDDDDVFDDDDDSGGDRVAPYAEGTLTYALAQNTSISWVSRYSIEQPSVPDAFSRTTFRTGVAVRHAFTPRITGWANIFYQHDDNDEAFIDGTEFSEDSLDLSLLVRYSFSRNWAFDLGYAHTSVWSDLVFRDYDRNRFWAGVTWGF